MVEGEDRGLGDFLNPTGVNALGTDENAPHLVIHTCPYPLQIWVPDSFCFIISVADVMSYRSSLTADAANSCHN